MAGTRGLRTDRRAWADPWQKTALARIKPRKQSSEEIQADNDRSKAIIDQYIAGCQSTQEGDKP